GRAGGRGGRAWGVGAVGGRGGGARGGGGRGGGGGGRGRGGGGARGAGAGGGGGRRARDLRGRGPGYRSPPVDVSGRAARRGRDRVANPRRSRGPRRTRRRDGCAGIGGGALGCGPGGPRLHVHDLPDSRVRWADARRGRARQRGG